MLRKVQIVGLTVDEEANAPVLILRTEETEQAVPIWIGLLEATAIASALQQIEFDRPMTHDLFKNFITRMNTEVIRIDICDLKNNTFFAKLHFLADEQEFFLDARPSDAIALAVRFQAPIYIDEKVIAELTSGGARTYQMEDQSEEGKKWADYLEKLSPEDFGKYKV